MLSIYLSEKLERLATQSQSTIFLEYYCDSKDDRRNSATAILRGLLYQLLESRPNLFKHIIPDFQIRGEELFARSSFLSLWKIFRDMLQDPDLKTVYCVLDGLDECDGDSLEMLLYKLKSLFLTELGSNTVYHLKMIITSRDLPDLLPEVLSSFPRITLDLDADAEINHDIHRFIEDKINELSKFRRYPDQLCAHVKDVFRKRAQGTFLWIGIAAQDLRGHIATEVEEALKSFPSGLEPLFARMLLQIKPKRRQAIAQILRWVVMAARPLTVSELSIAVKQPNYDHDYDHTVPFSGEEVIRDQILSCRFFLSITKDTVNLLHQSIKDYLLRKISDSNAELEAFRIKEDEGNLELARRCFYYLQDDALVSEQPVNNPQTFKMGYGRRQGLRREFPLLSYAMEYWPLHASAVSHQDDIFDVSHRFYKDPKFCAIWREMYVWREMYIWGEMYILRETYYHFRRTRGQSIPFNLLHIATYFNLRVLAENIISNFRSVESKKSSGAEDQLNEPDTYSYGRTALHVAAGRGHVIMIQLLLDKEAHIDARDHFSMTPLHVAIEHPHLTVIRLLLDRKASIEAKHRSGQTPLHCAAWCGHSAVARLLLDRGAYIEAKNSYGETPLHCAARRGCSAIVELMLNRGAFIEAKNLYEETPLLYAAGSGHSAVVELLLDRGASIMVKNSYGGTPLHCAAWGKVKSGLSRLLAVNDRHLAVVRLLLDRGASIDSKKSSGETPLHHAAWNKLTAVMELLLDRGAFVDAKNRRRMTPLHIAVGLGHLPVVQLLLRYRANLEMKSNKGKTALHRAAELGSNDIVLVLLDAGALTDAQDKLGRTAVHHAVEQNHAVTLRHLLIEGASTEIRDCDGLTALQVAEQSRSDLRMTMVGLIKKFQSNVNANE